MKNLIVLLAVLLQIAPSFAWELANPQLNVPPFPVSAEEKIRFKNISALAAELHADYNAKRPDHLKRTQHHKIHGCLQGSFAVSNRLPSKWQTPLMQAGKEYKMWARFSNIKNDDDSERDLRGMGIKILDPSKDPAALIGQDFLGNDTPKHFVRTPEQLMDFLHFMNGNRVPTPELLGLLASAALQSYKRHSLLEMSYHSRTHYQFGSDRVRYGLFPCDKRTFENVEIGTDHLRKNLRAEFKNKAQCFEFKVQSYDPKLDPDLADYTEEWHTQYLTAAVMVFPKQDIVNNDKVCEALSFDPWRALREHKPLGVLNKARWYIYRNSRIQSKK